MAAWSLPTLLVLCMIITHQIVNCKKEKEKEKENKRDKNIGKKVTDYNDADIEKLLDQWNDNDDDYEDLDHSDKPWEKPKPKIDMQKILAASGNKEDIIMESKKGQPLMIFANVAGNPTKKQTEKVSGYWQTSLQNANIQVQRYVVSDNRILLQIQDGSMAFKIRDFLVSQDTCESVSFENMDFPGKGKGKQKLEL